MGPHAEHPKGLPSHLLRSVSGVKATLFSLCPGPRKGLNRLSISRKLWVSWRAGLGVPSPACLPCPDTALWYQPSVSSAPFQGCGLQRGRYSELPHECRCKDSVSSGGIGLGGVEGRVSEHVCDLEAQPRSERPRGAEQTLAEDPQLEAEKTDARCLEACSPLGPGACSPSPGVFSRATSHTNQRSQILGLP